MPEGFDAAVEAAVRQIDAIEAETLRQMELTSKDKVGQLRTLGKLMLNDKHLSVNQNQACNFCHAPWTGFSGGIETLNKTTVSYPGSVGTRFGPRNPQSYGYSTFAPVLHYNPLRNEFIGGNFWDMRATGYRLQNPAAEQAQGPPITPWEMGFADSACVAYRLSQVPYRALFETVWGADSFSIHWPQDVEKVCSTPGPAPQNDPYPLHLSPADRQKANAAFDAFGLSAAAYEAGSDVSPFSSKFDYVKAGIVKFTAQEQRGYDVFRGRAMCSNCHIDKGPGDQPLFTDFSSSNVGVPRNPDQQYFYEITPDDSGYVVNPAGAAYVDKGVGAFLREAEKQNLNAAWRGHTADFDGKFQVPTLRNVDMRPTPNFVKAYMHNGYFKSLKEVVHFYNTRDVLPRCKPGDPGEKATCWPPPEDPTNMNTMEVGDLGLTPQQEDDLVAFLKTLTDNYQPPKSPAKK